MQVNIISHPASSSIIQQVFISTVEKLCPRHVEAPPFEVHDLVYCFHSSHGCLARAQRGAGGREWGSTQNGWWKIASMSSCVSRLASTWWWFLDVSRRRTLQQAPTWAPWDPWALSRSKMHQGRAMNPRFQPGSPEDPRKSQGHYILEQSTVQLWNLWICAQLGHKNTAGFVAGPSSRPLISHTWALLCRSVALYSLAAVRDAQDMMTWFFHGGFSSWPIIFQHFPRVSNIFSPPTGDCNVLKRWKVAPHQAWALPARFKCPTPCSSAPTRAPNVFLPRKFRDLWDFH